MGATSKFALPFPEQGDPVDVAGDIKKLADAVDAAIPQILPKIAGAKIVYGFQEAGAIGAVTAGGLYTWKVTVPGITAVHAAYAIWKHISTPALGWVAPGSVANVGRLEVGITVAYQPPNEVLLTAYFPLDFTVDSRGGEGVQWMVIGA